MKFAGDVLAASEAPPEQWVNGEARGGRGQRGFGPKECLGGLDLDLSGRRRAPASAESDFRASDNQVTKGVWWMPRLQEATKDAGGCDKPRGAVNQALIRGFPNGETRGG